MTVKIKILVSLGNNISTAFRQHPPRPPASVIDKQGSSLQCDRQARHPIAEQQPATSSAPPQRTWHTDPCVATPHSLRSA
jgi:hypothetical protein